MSLATFFSDKCLKNLEENVALLLAMLTDPTSAVSVTPSDDLQALVSGDLGTFSNFAEDYIKNNADTLILESARVLGYDDELQNALDMVYNFMALSLMMYNDLLLMFLKKVAQNIIVEINKKDNQIARIRTKLQALYNALVLLTSDSPVWSAYVEQLRDALKMLGRSKTELQIVRNTLSATDYFLSGTFRTSKDRLDDAKKLVIPLKNNPYLDPSYQGLLTNLGAPVATANIDLNSRQMVCREKHIKQRLNIDDRVVISKSTKGNNGTYVIQGLTRVTVDSLNDAYLLTMNRAFAAAEDGASAEFFRFDRDTGTYVSHSSGVTVFQTGPKTIVSNFQVAAIMAIPALSKEVAKAGQGYMTTNALISTLLDGFMLGYGQLQAGLPAVIKKYVLSLFDSNLTRLGSLTRSMALELNGAEDNVNGPPARDPQPLKASVLSYKWAMDLTNIINSLKLIPEEQLSSLNVAAGAVAKYQEVVTALKAMDGKRSGGAVLIQQDAKEATGAFESQMLTFLIEANAAIVSASIREEILALGRSMFERLDLAEEANREIRDQLQSFIDYPIASEDVLIKLMEGLSKMLSDLGFDNAISSLEKGEFENFFKMNAQTATTIGAALAVVAQLKKCYGGKRNDQLNEIENDLKAQKDAVSFNLSLNFRFAIFKNLEDCLKLRGFARVFDLQEVFCKLLKENQQVSKALEKFVDFVSF